MRYLFLVRQSPYGSSLAREALDMALATAAFDQKVQLVFINDGVYQLLQNQQAESLGRKNIGKTLDVLPLYEISDIYADRASVAKRYLSEDALFNGAKVVDQTFINELVQQADKVMVL